eukprot:gene16928-biopygen3824
MAIAFWDVLLYNSACLQRTGGFGGVARGRADPAPSFRNRPGRDRRRTACSGRNWCSFLFLASGQIGRNSCREQVVVTRQWWEKECTRAVQRVSGVQEVAQRARV